MGFEHLKELYEIDPDFKEAFEACQNPLMQDISPWLYYKVQDGLLFKRGQFFIPRCSMHENLIQEKHSGGLTEHFWIDKTME